jgi:putative flippase GtrA
MMNSGRQGLVSAPRPSSLVSLLRYVLVGLTQNGLFYIAMLLLLWCGLRAWQATIILYPVAVLISFLINRRWSFAGRKMSGEQLHRYVFVYVAAYFSTIFLNWAQEKAGVPAWLAVLITMAIMVGVIFAALNWWVFRERQSDPVGSGLSRDQETTGADG